MLCHMEWVLFGGMQNEGANHKYVSRDHDPQMGRYLESDPIGLDGGSYSTYAYVRGQVGNGSLVAITLERRPAGVG